MWQGCVHVDQSGEAHPAPPRSVTGDAHVCSGMEMRGMRPNKIRHPSPPSRFTGPNNGGHALQLFTKFLNGSLSFFWEGAGAVRTRVFVFLCFLQFDQLWGGGAERKQTCSSNAGGFPLVGLGPSDVLVVVGWAEQQ